MISLGNLVGEPVEAYPRSYSWLVAEPRFKIRYLFLNIYFWEITSREGQRDGDRRLKPALH